MSTRRWIIPVVVEHTNVTTSPYGTKQLQFVLRDPDTGYQYRHWWSIEAGSRSYPRTLREAVLCGLDPTSVGFDWRAFDTPLDEFGFPTKRTSLMGLCLRAQVDPRPRSYLKILKFLPPDYEPSEVAEEER